jgi:hypothetical protein
MDDEASNPSLSDVGGFLGRQHDRLYFDELFEPFFARAIALKCPNLDSREPIVVPFSLRDLFRRYTPKEIEDKLVGLSFTSASKETEIFADLTKAKCGIDLEANYEEGPAFDYYHNHIESRLRWLSPGNEIGEKLRDVVGEILPCIEGFIKRTEGPFTVFDVTVRPAVLLERLARSIESYVELKAKLFRTIMMSQSLPGYPGLRIDFRKQVELLTEYLERRQRETSEIEFTILSSQIPFRWALQVLALGPALTAPAIGTTTADDKVLLLLFLELNGLIDILAMDIDSDPSERHNIVVRFFVRRPARDNIFNATAEGLDADARRVLKETELSIYARLHSRLRDNLTFGGRPNLERSFGTCCSWFLRKIAYCLEEPSFIATPAIAWLAQHSSDPRIQMEDEFFLPSIYERLRSDFGSRVVKKPERFGGEIDILFDDNIPIELKVRRGRKQPLDLSEVDDTFRPSGQAAAYASISRLGFVAILDIPDADVSGVNLESCVSVVDRRIPEDNPYPTSIVVVTFRCQHSVPSGVR